MIQNIFNKPCIKRALRTFIQAAAGYAAVNLLTTDLNACSAVKGLIISAVSAGLAAVMNLNEKSDEKSESEEKEDE